MVMGMNCFGSSGCTEQFCNLFEALGFRFFRESEILSVCLALACKCIRQVFFSFAHSKGLLLEFLVVCLDPSGEFPAEIIASGLVFQGRFVQYLQSWLVKLQTHFF